MASEIGYALVLQLIDRINSLLLDGASGTDLARYGIDHYQLPPKGAAGSVGQIRFFRTAATAGAGTVNAGTLLATLGGTQFITTSAATFGATQLDKVVANIRAVQAGAATEVGANTIVRIQQPSALFDPSIQCNNDVFTSGGADPEDDDVYRNRIRNFWNTARRGTLAAIAQGAQTVPGVESATASEAINGLGQPARVVLLYFADGAGQANQQLAAQVLQTEDDFRAGGIAVIAQTSIPQIVVVQLSLTFTAGVDTTTLAFNIRQAVVLFINSLGVNQPLYRADLFSLLRRFVSSGLIQNQAAVVAPAGDLIPGIGMTLRTTIDQVTTL